MRLDLIEMPRGEALQKFREYRDSVRDRHDAELSAITEGYRQLAKGRQLIRLTHVIEAGGFHSVEFKPRYSETRTVSAPNLAVCKADEEWCTYRLDQSDSITFCGYKDEDANKQGVFQPWNHRSRHRRVRAEVSVKSNVSEGDLHAMVPLVPPPLRPRAHLSNFHVLWEVDQWTPRRPPAPRDPALLKRIGGDLFAVLAVWDLTDLERAVLAGRSL